MTPVLLLLPVAGVVVAGGYFLLRLLRHLSSRPILEITLSPIENPKWTDGKKITDLIASLRQGGFESAGDYECREVPSLTIAGFVHLPEQMVGVIYDHPLRGIWVDLFVQYDDGGSLTVSGAPTRHELDRMPQETISYSEGGSVEELLRRVRAERRQDGRVTITREEFASHFEAQYRKEMEWRVDRGGPTYLEVRRVAEAMGESTDGERLQEVTRQARHVWTQERNKPRQTKSRASTAVLPREFQQPEEFRRKKGQESAPVPRLNIPALPVYLVLAAAMVSWCYYGYQYNKTNFPLSLTAFIVFSLVFLVPFLAMIAFWEFDRRVRMCPVLQRMADLRRGAFLVIVGVSPALFYARERWIGKVSFQRGSEHENAFTRLDATTREPLGRLEIARNTVLSKVVWGADQDAVQLPASDFSRRFKVLGSDRDFAEAYLSPAISGALMRLEALGRPFVAIHRNSVRVEIESDLARPRKEAALRQFLEEAETIIETATQSPLAEFSSRVRPPAVRPGQENPL